MSDGGEDSPPPRPRRTIKRIVLASSSSASESDDSGPATSTRKKRLRVLSDEDSESSGSSVALGSRRRRALPKLRDSDGDSDTSGWATDHSDAPAATLVSKAPRPVSGFASDSSNGNSDKCSICLMHFTDQQVGTPQSCEHIFCLDCIMEWSRNVNTCPVDRMTFDFIVVRACAGGRVLCTQPVQVVERAPSVEMLLVEDPTTCEICGSASSEETMLLCDGCDHGFHMECLSPPITQVPLEQWLCPSCMDRMEGFDVVQVTSDMDELFSDASDERAPRRGGRPARRPRPAQPSTSGRAAPSARRRAAPARTRRAKPRTRTVIIEYELERNGKCPVTRRVKRRLKKRKAKKRKPRTAARRTLVRESVRARLAALRGERSGARPVRAAAAAPLAVRRARAAVPALSLFGSARDLDYFSEEEAAGASEGAAVAARPASACFGVHRQARRKMMAIPSPPHAAAAADVLSSILESQTLLHSRRSAVSITPAGDLDIRPEPPRGAPRAALPATEGGAARQAPAYPGRSRGGGGGGWGGGYRYPREPAGGPGRGGERDNGYGGGHPAHGPAGRHRGGDDGERFDGYGRAQRYPADEGPFERQRRPPGPRRPWPPPPARAGAALDMRLPPADKPAPPCAPLPEPPAFPLDEEDERSDSSLVIDTEKYDPTEPTNDDEDEEAAPPPPPPPPPTPPPVSPVPPPLMSPVPPLAPPPPLAAVESLLAGLEAGVPHAVLDSAVRQVLQEHRLMEPAQEDASDGDSDGDCPNFSIYSATSVHIASSSGAGALPAASPPAPAASGLEDLVQGDGDASPDPPADLARRKADEYNERLSKRCPITTNTRNPIKIKLNAPSLIRRQVTLYDEDDAESDAEPEATEPKEPASSPPRPRPELEPRSEVEPEPEPELEPELVPEPEPEPEPEVEREPAPEPAEAQEERALTPELEDDGDSDTDASEEVERDDSERGAGDTPSIPEEPPAPGLDKMTESISETEDERSYTPCLDEHRERDEPERGIEGLDTEMISEDEGNEMFFDEERRALSPPPASPLGQPDPAPPLASDDAKKKRKKDSKKEAKERKGKAKRAEVAFKKAGKAAKERNYREREKDDKDKKRERRDSADSERQRRRKEKRKDLERYDVRTLVSEKRRRTKDAFGRDVSPRASPSPSPPPSPARRASPSPARRASPSPARRASPSPRRARPSASPSPPPAARRSASPRRRRRRSASRAKRAEVRRRRSGSRARKRRRSASAGSPKPKAAKKKKRARSEKPHSRSPRRKSPKRKRVRRAAGAAWSPRSEPRPASPRTPPPAPPRRPRRRDRSKHRRPDAAGPSKEVFTSGDNILVSVSFSEAEAAGGARRERRRERRRRRRAAAEDAPKPVAIIDLARSPFRELTPSPKNVIVLSDDEAPGAAPPAAGPKTPPAAACTPAPGAAPDSPDAYDPYEPTASPAPAPAPEPMTLEAAQKTNMSADEVLDRRPLSPIEKVLALLQSTRDAPPDPPPEVPAAPPAPEPPRAPPPKLFLAKPSPIKSDPIKPMQQATKISRLPLPRGDSPYSPGSSDFGSLFSPPPPGSGAPGAGGGAAGAGAGGGRHDSFDALFDKAPRRKRGNVAKVPVKLNKKKGKTQVDVKIDDDSLKVLDDLPSSAVEMQVKSKVSNFLKKLNRQERVVEEVKLVLKPHYNKKHVSKDEYKHILRRTVPKICHNKTGEINPTKIQALVEAYVKKFRKKHKLGVQV